MAFGWLFKFKMAFGGADVLKFPNKKQNKNCDSELEGKNYNWYYSLNTHTDRQPTPRIGE